MFSLCNGNAHLPSALYGLVNVASQPQLHLSILRAFVAVKVSEFAAHVKLVVLYVGVVQLSSELYHNDSMLDLMLQLHW